MDTNPLVSIIIPAYNEEEIIENAILQALQVSVRFPLVSEVIVINDGSSDKTA
ncbi:MAG: glycosyltransferase family 2 protein, partial [Microcystis sp.]